MKSPLFVSHVTSTIKGGVDVALGPKTLIVGRNGSGKSAAVQSLQLALRGCVSELDGRYDVSAPARLIRLFDRGVIDPTCYARATFNDGSVSSWSVPEGKKEGRLTLPGFDVSCGDALWSPDTVEPLALVRAAALGDDATVRAFFLGRVGVTTTAEAVKSQLSSKLADRYASLRSQLDPQSVLTEVDFLLRSSKECASRARASTAEAKKIRDTLARSSASVTMIDAGELATLRRQLGEAEARERAAVETARVASLFTSGREIGRRTLAACETTAAAVKEAEAALLEARALLDGAEAVSVVQPEYRRALQTLRDSVVAGRGCLCCGNVAAEGLAERLQTVETWIDRNDASSSAVGTAQRAVAAAEQRVASTTATYNTALGRHNAALEAWQALTAAHPDFNPDDLPVPTLNQEASVLRQKIATAEAASSGFSAAKTLRDDAEAADDAAIEWKKLDNECKRIIGSLLAKALDSFNEAVNALLPPDDVFKMIVSGEDMKHIEFGFVRSLNSTADGYATTTESLHTALSGAERARELCALASVVASGVAREGSPARAVPYHFIVPDDTGYDSATLAEMLTAFENAPGQVIIATPTIPDSVSAAWTVVRT